MDERVVSDSIIEQINDLENRLRPMSRDQQRERLEAERGAIMALVRQLVRDHVRGESTGLWGLTRGAAAMVVGSAAWCMQKITGFLGFDPFSWMCYEEYDYNTHLAAFSFSTPELFVAINQAAEALLRVDSTYLCRKSTRFTGVITEATGAMTLAEDIVRFCRTLAVASSTGVTPLLIDGNDIKVVLADILKLILDEKRVSSEIKETYQSPLIQGGGCGWVKYSFESDMSVESSCCSETKTCDVETKIVYFFFPSEADFRAALRHIERQ